MLTAIYHMLTKNEEFNPCYLYKVNMLQKLVEKQKKKAIRQVLKLLISQDLIPETTVDLEVSLS